MADVRLGDAVTTGGPSRRIIAALVVEFLLIVGGLTTAVVLANNSASHSGPIGSLMGDQSANNDAADQADAVSVARQFVLNSDAFTPANLKQYIADLMPLMTTKAQTALTSEFAQFQSAAGAVLSQVTKDSKAAATPSSGDIEFAALSNFTSTTATVLVAHDVLYNGVKSSQCLDNPDYCQSKRWSVVLRKVGGAWLVDSFNPSV